MSILSENAIHVLERRYLLEDESPEEMFRRVAHHVARLDENSLWEDKFYDMMSSLDFLPNSPTMMNAGTDQGSLSACFVIPVPDTLEGILEASKAAGIVQKYGGGTGFSLSKLRRGGSPISSTQGAACGPISVLRHLDDVSRLVTQGGKREGANMGILRYDHPDILEFITCKDDVEKHGLFRNFNISVGMEQEFFDCLEPYNLGNYELIDPHSGPTGEFINAAEVWETICEQAWKTGDPGLVFLDRINSSRANPVPSLGPIISTNPCGEQPLYAWDSCNLGSINLVNFFAAEYVNTEYIDAIQWNRLRETTHLAVRFLDNVIETNFYALPEIEKMNKDIRRIGLGVMGFADLLYLMKIRYDSEEALELAEEIGSFINIEAQRASMDLGQERGNFLKFTESIYNGDVAHMRNSTRTTIAPTGTISIIAGVSSGIEPNFALEFDRQHGENIGKMKEKNPIYQAWLDTQQPFAFKEDNPDYFVVSYDIDPEWHVKMQAAWQSCTDNAVSKTINMPNSTTPEEIGEAYKLAWDEDCLGVTVFRDGSRSQQVLTDTKKLSESFSVPIETMTPLNHEESRTTRKKLPDTAPATRHKFNIAGTKGYIHVGMYEDGCPGEVFITLTKEGSTLQGLLATVAKLTSMLLQRGVTTADLREDFMGTRFEPHGLTQHPDEDMKMVNSIIDYLFRYLFKIDPTNKTGIANIPLTMNIPSTGSIRQGESIVETVAGGLCPDCGAILVHEEGCEKCYSCGYSSC
jgi:ribonucleoside-diphosphate reductase alpha chain